MLKFNFDPSRFYILIHEPTRLYIIVEMYQDHLLANMIKYGGRKFKSASKNHIVTCRYLNFDAESNSYEIEKTLHQIKVNELIVIPFKTKIELKLNRLIWYFKS